MFNRKIEARSQSIMNLATVPLITEHPFTTIVPIDQRLLELYHLFIQEERLAALIADDKKTVDKETISEVVASARKIAAKGYPTTLVSTDELLDITQTFCFKNPNAARIEQELVLEDPQNPPFGTRLTSRKFLNYAAALTTSPDTNTASSILVKLLAQIKDQDNTAWTARVAAALAYFSNLQGPSL